MNSKEAKKVLDGIPMENILEMVSKKGTINNAAELGLTYKNIQTYLKSRGISLADLKHTIDSHLIENYSNRGFSAVTIYETFRVSKANYINALKSLEDEEVHSKGIIIHEKERIGFKEYKEIIEKMLSLGFDNTEIAYILDASNLRLAKACPDLFGTSYRKNMRLNPLYNTPKHRVLLDYYRKMFFLGKLKSVLETAK